ncbi:MAG: acyl-ACP--UDP-N- acetylglucosamine O-acyltransferase, partial [Actinomycetia bacterium]|nr:acyl-ACP--UDP-N- acetylglucosamine O-acyltransferase [Actinomycetes bacterium]
MRIHPTAVIGPGVEFGIDVVVGPHAVVLGPCRIADGVRIGPLCVIGSPPELTTAAQNAAWDDELMHAGVEVGAGTILREATTVQQGADTATRIGSGCWLLSRSYVAHDCVLEDGVTTSAGVAVGGRSHIGRGATLGMNATVHQRRVVGPGAMVGMSSAVTRNVPPYAKVYGTPARMHGANVVGMTRHGVGADGAAAVDTAYAAEREPEVATLVDPVLVAAW